MNTTFKNVQLKPRFYKAIIPVDWHVAELSKVGDIITGSTPSTSNSEFYGSNYLWATPEDLSEIKFVNDTKTKLTKKGFDETRKISENSILFVCIGSTIGKIGFSKEKISTNQQINSIICKKYAPQYVYYQLLSHQKKIKNLENNVAIPIINKTDFGKFKIPLPNEKKEQQKIGSILSNVDDSIQKTSEQIEKIKQLKTGLMQKLLTKGIGHTKFKKVQLTPRYIQLKIPDQWEIKKIQQICLQVTDGVHKTPEYQDKGIPFVSVNNLASGKLDFSKCEFVSKKDHQEMIKRCHPQKDDILLSKVGTLGIADVIKVDFEFSIFVQLALLKPDKSQILPTFLKYLLTSHHVNKRIHAYAAGTTLQYIGVQSIEELSLPIPKNKEQQKIASILSNVDSQIESLESKKSQLQKTKQGLMQKLLTGKIRVQLN